jgi:hypothetical protein
MIKLTEYQRKRLNLLMGDAFITIRSLTKSNATQEEKAEAYIIADGFHNLHKMLERDIFDTKKLLLEMGIAGKKYQDRVIDILSSRM